MTGPLETSAMQNTGIVRNRLSYSVSKTKYLCWLLVFSLVLNLALTEVPAWSADYRATPQSKLDAAAQFVKDFLVRDAAANEVFFQRQVIFPASKDYPLIDCEIQSFVRAIEQRGTPVFESADQKVVNVPVVAELLLVEAGEAGGPDVRPGVEGHSWCSFEYERYSFETQRFESLPQFRQHSLNIEFKSWGEALPKWRSTPLPEGLEDDRYVAIDLEKRYVRYFVRVNVTGSGPSRTWPQVPRHWFARDVISKLDYFNERRRNLLSIGVSDRNPNASGKDLAADLVRMRHQLEERTWVANRLKAHLERLESIAPFSDLKDKPH